MTKNSNARNTQTATVMNNTQNTQNTCYISLPFTWKHCIRIRNGLRTLYRKYHPNISLRIIFTIPRCISSFFTNRDFLSTLHRSSLVYKYKCGSCNASYIGETSRHLQTRVDEHHGISSHVGNPIYSYLHSSIRYYCHQTGHAFSSDSFTIITIARTNYELTTKESILIRHHLPTLDTNLSSCFLHLHS